MKPACLVILIALFFSCKKDDPAPVQMLSNADMEGGTTQPNVWFLGHTSTDISTSWTTAAASSPTHSLAMTRTAVANPTGYASWAQSFSGAIPFGKDLTFTIRIKGDNLQGPGVSIALRCDGATTPDLQFSSTQYVTSITGTFDWKTYNIKLTSVVSDTKYIIVYMVYLEGTTGTVYFDDAFLTHN